MHIVYGLLCILASVFYCSAAAAQDETCSSLVQYRDGSLFAENEKYLRKIEGLENSIDLYLSLSKDIESSSTAQLLAISDALLVVTKVTSDIVSAAIPPAWVAKSAASDVSKALQLEMLSSVDFSRDVNKLMNDATLYDGSKLILKYSGTGIGSSLSGVAEAIDTLVEGAERSEDWTDVINLLTREEKNIGRQLNLLGDGIKEYQAEFLKVNSIKQAIDENCSGQSKDRGDNNDLSNLDGKFLVP